MFKYLKLLGKICHYNLIREMEFRGNFAISAAAGALWIIVQLFTINIYFNFTDNISGWTKPEVFILIGMFRIVVSLFNIFIYNNLTSFSYQMSEGALDYLLVKPVNSLFLVSFSRQMFTELGNLVVGVSLVIYTLVWGQVSLVPGAYVLMFISIPVGLVVLYSIMLFVATFAVFLTRLTAMSTVYGVFTNILRYPTDIYVKPWFLLIFLAPFALIVTLPAKLVLGKLSPLYLVPEVLAAGLIFLAVYQFWLYSLKHYTSSGS